MSDSSQPSRGFSIAFAWIGLVAGGFGWILYWGARNLPQRGSTERWQPEFTALDVALLVVIPLAVAAVLGRWGRGRLP